MKILMVPIYSMRSHETGTYNLLLDSNMNIALHKCSVLPKEDKVTITIPIDSNQIDECTHIINTFDCQVEFLPIKYGKNAGETRQILNDSVQEINHYHYDKVELGVAVVEPVIENTEYHIYNSSVLGRSRPYADKVFPLLLKRLEQGYRVNFSCTNQLYKIPMKYLHLCSTDMKLYSKEFGKYMMDEFTDQELFMKLDAVATSGAYFFPFRISDPCYKWEYVSQTKQQILITNPNETRYPGYNIVDISSMHKCKKTLYCTMLALMRSREDIRIPIYEDISGNYHISIVEMVDAVHEGLDFHVPFERIKFISRYMR